MRGSEGALESSLNVIAARSITRVRRRGGCQNRDLRRDLLYGVWFVYPFCRDEANAKLIEKGRDHKLDQVV